MKYFVLILFVMSVSTGCQRTIKNDKTVYIKAVESMLGSDGELAESTYRLGDSDAHLSIDGQIVVHHFEGGAIGYVFIVWRGKGSNFLAVAYFPDRKFVDDFPDNINYYGANTVSFSPFEIDGGPSEVDAEVIATDTESVFVLTYNLD